MNPLLWIASIVFLALSYLDLTQTLELQKLGAVENNPLLGKHPKPKTLIAFAVITTGLWLGAAIFLALKDAPGIWAVIALGIGLRAWTVSKSRKLKKELKR